MTTYQDQPLSRRAIREREAEAARAASTPEGTPVDGAPENGAAATDAPATGGTDATSSSAPTYAGTPEPLTYVTQGRAPLPQYDAPVASEPTPAEPASTEASESDVEADAGYRYRDFSPEGRRAARLGWPQASTESSNLDYRTQGRADVPAAPEAAPEVPEQAPEPSTPQSQAPVSGSPLPEGGLSRRELRTLREQQERDAGIAPASDEPQANASAAPIAADPFAATPFASAPFASAPFSSAPPAYERSASAAPAYEAQVSSPPVATPAFEAPAFEAPTFEAPAPEAPASEAPPAAPEWLAAFAPPTALGDAQAEVHAAEVQPTEPAAAAFDDILIGETVDDADDADEASGPVVVAEQVREVPPPLIEPAEPTTDALASFEALFRGDPAAPPSQSTTPPAPAAPSLSPIFPTPLQSTPPAFAPAPSAPPVSAPPVSAPLASAPPVAAYTAPPVIAPTEAPVETPAAEAPQAEAPQAEAPQAEAPADVQAEAPRFEAPPMPTFAQYADGLQPPSPLGQAPAPDAPSAPAAAPFNLAFIPAAPASEVPQASAPEAAVPEAPATDSQPPVAGERPRNHWSRQAELDDEAPETGAITRSVGSAPATASALVLPEIPAPDFMATPLTSTGDVVVTGSISLPASLSSTGALPTQLDESDLDHLLDPGDHQVASTDSQPVRAIRAVSTHTSSREIIGTIKPKRSNRALTALIISAAGMAVVVVALLVVAVASGVLG